MGAASHPPSLFGHDPAKIAARFWSKVKKTDGCWLWLASCNSHGYGQLMLRDVQTGARRPRGAHRIAYELSFGSPGNMFVCHTCDTPACVRPDHLFLGTNQDNVNDMVKKGRCRPPVTKRGELAGSSKLTEAQVRSIFERYNAGEIQVDIAASMDVTQSAVSSVLRGQTWGHLNLSKSRMVESHSAKLNDALVVQAYRRWLAGEKRSDIAASMGVSDSTIDLIVNGKTWKHLGLVNQDQTDGPVASRSHLHKRRHV